MHVCGKNAECGRENEAIPGLEKGLPVVFSWRRARPLPPKEARNPTRHPPRTHIAVQKNVFRFRVFFWGGGMIEPLIFF